MGAVFAAVFGSVFQGFVNFFLNFVTKRVALSAAAIALFFTVLAALIFTMQALIASIAVAAPDEIVLAAGWFLPNNADECLAAYFSARTARFIYDTKTKVIQYSLF